MCGISGIIAIKGHIDREMLVRMNDSLVHRGPDGSGVWVNDEKNIAFGHRRLAIVDLTDKGAQPMHLEERYTITFNGEIYNYLELRKELILLGYTFKTETDTEVILVAYHVWKEKCLSKLDGMFAFALYDKEQNTVFMARDRFGEKPFYFSKHKESYYFGSEMKAIWAAQIPKAINHSMTHRFLAYDLVENPENQAETFYSNIQKLKAGHFMIFANNKLGDQKPYWKISTSTTASLSSDDAQQKFYALFQTSVQRRLRSDVQVGSSLSGGLDSSAVVSTIHDLGAKSTTFSARFPNSPKDEGKYIEIVKNHFQTQHFDIPVQIDGFHQDLTKLLYHQEEPFQSGSIYAQYQVYEKARAEDYKVLLDGQGADELLGGYDMDFKFYLKELSSNAQKAKYFQNCISKNHNYTTALNRKDILNLKFPASYQKLAKLKHQFFPEKFAGIAKDFSREFADEQPPFREFHDLKSKLAYELSTQGLEKLLKFADRNSMAHSVEVRLPFLYHELVEFVFSLPSDLFLENGWSKAILRNAMDSKLPTEIARRKDKIGFEAPHMEWMKNSKIQNEISDLKNQLVLDKIIDKDFTNEWKILIAGKWLKE